MQIETGPCNLNILLYFSMVANNLFCIYFFSESGMIKGFAMTLSFTGKFGISGAWMAACLFTPEIYPTNIRFIPKFITRLDMILAIITCIFIKQKQPNTPR